MIAALLLTGLAWGFAGEPTRECREDFECVLVRETFCGGIAAVRYGNDQAWADWDAKQRAKAEKEKRVCGAGERVDPRSRQAVCRERLCVAVERAQPKEEAASPAKLVVPGKVAPKR